jgi:hypothetical protein
MAVEIAKLLTKDEERRIAANVAKLPKGVAQSLPVELKTSRGVKRSASKQLRLLKRGAVFFWA